MDIDDLKAIIKRGDLVNMSISSEGTQKSFAQLVEIMEKQEQEIDKIKCDLSLYLTTSEFETFKKSNTLQIQKTNRAIPQFEQSLKLTISELEVKNEALHQEIHETLTAVIQTVDDKIESVVGAMRDDVISLKSRIEEIEPKLLLLSAPSSQEIKSYVPPVTKDQIQAVQKRVLLLEKKMSDMESRVAFKEDIKLHQEEVESKIDEALTSRLESNQTFSLIQSMSQANFDTKSLKKNGTDINSQAKLAPLSLKTDSSGTSSSVSQSPFMSNDLPIEPIAEDDPPPSDSIEGVRETISLLETKVDENNKMQLGKLERKADLTVVEHMFERLRTLIASTNDDIASTKTKIQEYVTKDEMEEWLTKTLAQMNNEDKNIPYQTDALAIAGNAAKETRPGQPKKVFKIKKQAMTTETG